MQTRCPECEESLIVPDPPEEPELSCVVCGARWTPSSRDPDPAWRVPAGAPAMWARLLDDYESDKVHGAFIQYCRRAGRLDYAARRYRRALDRAEGTDEWATRGLERIQALAVSALAQRGRRFRLPEGLQLVLAGGLAVAVALLTAWLLRRMGLGS